LLPIHPKAELCTREQTERNADYGQPPIRVIEAEFGEIHGVLAVEWTGVLREMDDHVLSVVVLGDIAPLHSAAQCLNDIAGLINKNRCMAPMREDLIEPR
jgi:hypothetical protein